MKIRKKILAVAAATALIALTSAFLYGCAILSPAELFSRLGDNTYVEEHSITSVEIKSPPNVTEYVLGDKFSAEGMVLKVYYDDGYYSYETDFGMSIQEGKTITTQDGSFTATFDGWSVTQKLSVALPADLRSLLGEDRTTLRMEAENSEMELPEGNNLSVGTEGRTPEEVNDPSGGAFIANLSYDINVGSRFSFRFTAEKGGWCVLSAGMGSVGSTGAPRSFDECLTVEVNGVPVTVTKNPLYTVDDYKETGYPAAGYWNWTCKDITAFMIEEGENVVTLEKPASGSGLNFDYIELTACGALTAS